VRDATLVEAVASSLRQVKTGAEVGRIRAAAAVAKEVYRDLRERLEPGMSGVELFRFIQDSRRKRGGTSGWSAYNDPILTIGPVPFMGHTPPPEGLTFDRGMLLQVDLGVRVDGYCSDFQRMFYALRPMETHAPAEVERLFAGVYEGISRMIAGIGPGISNDGVTKHAFEAITDLGFPEPQYGGGHQLGRAVHDGGTGLLSCHSPMPGQVMKRGNVFTVEGLETRLAPYGWMSLEEDVAVTETGCEVLTERQTELWCV
jgi:Xaa-Pro aminopeptidase